MIVEEGSEEKEESAGESLEEMSGETEDGEKKEEEDTFYDKNDSFFDCISCEALERQEG